ncbi:MAG: HypC/HybG/HupF family hydrogenase formation chaperone [Eggerthellaceae bacterium]|jgi:hydrogenase expression/formation protein HypC|nr:HypC/HybG/HupF family hydrogenase formation chaperone [Eggerthellaceae bacterium]MDR2715610.1 HypC/HybG/HupF family hydrogenase formation chaperone [Coriobacteriaceae bacterium]
MCLAIPARINSIGADNLATVDIMGVTREASLDLTPEAREGDYVLVHAGFAIQVVSAEFAQETLDLISQFPELAADDLRSEAAPGAPARPSLGVLLSE